MTLDLMTLILAVTIPICGVAWLISGKLERLDAGISGIKQRLEHMGERGRNELGFVLDSILGLYRAVLHGMLAAIA